MPVNSLFVLVSFIISVLLVLTNASAVKEIHKTQIWCDDVLGCLNITDSWYSKYRPINVMPLPREHINTRFYLHTRLEPNMETDYVVSADDLTSLRLSPFDPTKSTKFVVHGFVNSGNTTWLKDLSAALLNYGDYNVFRVDWGCGSKPLYYQATANTRVVGMEMGRLVNTMISSWPQLSSLLVHCIGHSLGAHVCGYAGEQIVRMGRITGLDPAGPYFTGTEYFIHLDPTDANFVDVIHTDSSPLYELGFGTAEPMGNIDFYPNSGHTQPGCTPVSVAVDFIKEDFADTVACSHLRAIEYFQETLRKSNCVWLGHECPDYNSFQNGECFSCSEEDTKCAYMGMRTDEYVSKSREFVQLYLDTDKNKLFCMQHYQVSILTAYPSEAEPWVMGSIQISLYGDKGVIREKQITTSHEEIYHGQLKNFLLLSNQEVGHVLRVELKWDYDDSILDPGSYCWGLVCNRSLYVESIQVSAINHYPETERLEFTSLTCSLKGSSTKIKDGHSESFLISSTCLPV